MGKADERRAAADDAPVLLRRLGGFASLVGAVALLGLAVLQGAGVLARLAGTVVVASSELAFGPVIVLVSAALVVATLHGAHPRIHAFLELLSPRMRSLTSLPVALLTVAYWGLLTAVTARMTAENAALGEHTELLSISVIPFRVLWTLALAAVFAIVTVRAVRGRGAG